MGVVVDTDIGCAARAGVHMQGEEDVSATGVATVVDHEPPRIPGAKIDADVREKVGLDVQSEAKHIVLPVRSEAEGLVGTGKEVEAEELRWREVTLLEKMISEGCDATYAQWRLSTESPSNARRQRSVENKLSCAEEFGGVREAHCEFECPAA